jgi:hypothetical protein
MKRTYSLKASTVSLGLLLALISAACSGSDSERAQPAPAPPVQAPEPSGEPESGDDAADDGVDEAVLRMAITDLTTSGLSPNFEVWVRGTGSWFAAQDLLLESAGPFTTDQQTSFFIYPEGRDTPELEVELLVPRTVIPGSVRDLIEIEVYDDEIIVYGTSVPGFSMTYTW